MTGPITTYADAVAYLESLVDFEKLGFRRHFADTVSLDSIRALLDRLGNPQRGLPCVHIAGTKGKGSVAALVESIVRTAGYRTGLFTSPHLVSFRERLRADGHMALEAEITDLVRQISPAIEDLRAEGKLNPATFFEAYTAMAYLWFHARGTDLAVLETGLGGRLDATNTCEPIACAITTLGLDHTEILGDTIQQIATEKAGILKPGVPAVYAPQEPAAAAVLREVAATLGAPLRPAPAVLSNVPPRRLAVPDTAAELPRPCQQVTVQMAAGPLTVDLPLLGDHQAGNLAVALGLIELLREAGYSITDEQIRAGVAATRWPGRLQIVRARPWVILDAAHNGPAARALARALPGTVEYDRLIAVIGLSAEKDAFRFCAALALLVDVALLTQAGLSRALPAVDLQRLTLGFWRASERHDSTAAALARALELAGPRDCILVTGSFYVVGEAMAVLGVAQEEG
ncbi:MAG: bifunctional folylpolyglutamate synthase/dihydrofolate synthase [Armatimonadetes bacterium]|nr:bifunctional folylpolyglutamate synthase/dihydrofolate synthase [Armatimonadota bacterium]